MKFNRILVLGLLAVLFLTTLLFSGFTGVENSDSVGSAIPSADPSLIDNYLMAGPLVFLGILFVVFLIRKNRKRSK